MKITTKNFFKSDFHQKVLAGVQADYSDYLKMIRPEINSGIKSHVLTGDFIEILGDALQDSSLQHYSHLRFYWTHLIEQITYIDELHDEILEDTKGEYIESELFSEAEDDLFSFWQNTEYAESFLEMMNDEKTLIEASKELTSLIEHQIISFYWLHLKKDPAEMPFTTIYKAIPEIGDNETSIYVTDKHFFSDINNSVESFPHIPLQNIVGNRKAIEIEVDEDGEVIESSIDRRVDQFKIKNHGIFLLPNCEKGKAHLDDFKVRLDLALNTIKHSSPECYNTFKSFSHSIVPVNESGIVSYSMQSLPGYSCINMFDRDFVDLLDDLIHENGHHYLNAFLNQDDLINEDDEDIYFSPWRQTQRPIRGIYHAVYTFYWALKLFSDLYENHVCQKEQSGYEFNLEELAKITKRFVEEYYMLTYCSIDLAHAFEMGKVTPKGNELILAIYELIENQKPKLNGALKKLEELSSDDFSEVQTLIEDLKIRRKERTY